MTRATVPATGSRPPPGRRCHRLGALRCRGGRRPVHSARRGIRSPRARRWSPWLTGRSRAGRGWASASTSMPSPSRGASASCGSVGCSGRGSGGSTGIRTAMSRRTRPATPCCRRPGWATSGRTSAPPGRSSPAPAASCSSARQRGWCGRPASRSATSRSRSSATARRSVAAASRRSGCCPLRWVPRSRSAGRRATASASPAGGRVSRRSRRPSSGPRAGSAP